MNENEQAEPMELVPDLVLGEYFRLIREATTVEEVRRIVEEDWYLSPSLQWHLTELDNEARPPKVPV